MTAKKKAAAKRRRRAFDGPPACAWAIKRRKLKSNAWMPDECVIQFEADPAIALLIPAGWTASPDAADGIPQDRLEHNLPRIEMEWEEEFGKGWRIEIRPLA